MNYFKVKHFERFQHYKDRRPPWIKLYRDLWQDRDFYSLNAVNKLYVIGFFTLASETDNNIPEDINWIQSRLGISEAPDFKSLTRSGMIAGRKRDASAALAKSSTNNEVQPIVETETYKEETEREKETDQIPAKPSNRAPETFKVTNEMKSWARSKYPRINIDSATESFMDYEFKTPKKDWNAAWRNWIRSPYNTQMSKGECVARPVDPSEIPGAIVDKTDYNSEMP
jgi:hypothetical protein